MDLNKVMLIGNLTKDPEAKTIPSGSNISKFSIATNLVWTDAQGQKQEKVEFHNIIAWRKLADICNNYLKKGLKIYLEGRLQTTDWTGEDGIKRYRTEIVAENMIMLSSNTGGGQNTQQNTQNYTQPQQNIQSTQQNNTNEEEIKIENIPF